MKRLLYLSLFAFFISSCSKNALKQFQSGDTIGSYKTLYKKARKGNLERAERKLFKQVVEKMILEDSIDYFRLIDFETFTSDKKAYILFTEMDQRREEIDRLNMGLKNYTFLNYSDYDQLSKNITNEMFAEASNLLDLAASSGNPLDAREAYAILEEMRFYHTYHEFPVDDMQQVALELGVEHILVNFENEDFTNAFLIERYSDFDDLNLKNSIWQIYHEHQGFVQYNVIINVIVERARMYDNTDSNTRSYSEEIVSGYETTLDSAGNTVRNEIIEKVTATVTSSEVIRTLTIEGEVEFLTFNGGRFDEDVSRSYSESISTYTYTGDLRAIPGSVQRELDDSESFSSDDRFFREVMEEYLEEVGDIIEDIRY